MSWSVDWNADGARGAVYGDDDNTVYQHETVRFNLRLRGTDQNARDFVGDASNWTEPPRMYVTGIDGAGSDIRTITVEAARGSLLEFEYRFEFAGRKRIEFRGEIDMRRAQGERHGGVGARSTTMRERESADAERYETDVYTTYPPLGLSIPFEVAERATESEAHATTSGSGTSTRTRGRVLAAEREAAADERGRAASAAAEDAGWRDRRALRARRGVRRGVLRLPSPWTHLLTDEEIGELDEATMDEYSRDLQAAIRVTRPISMNGNEYSDGSHRYRGHWTWAHEGEDIVFYFLATQISIVGGGGRMRACDDEEAARARAHSSEGRTYGVDEWIVAELPGAEHKSLTNVEAFAHETDWTRIMAAYEVVDYVMTAFDVAECMTGVGAIIAGVRRVARWLVDNAARLGRRALATAVRHSDDLARTAARALAHGDDAVRASDDVARGLASESSAASGAVRGADDAARATDDSARGLGSGGSSAADEARGLASRPPRLVDDALSAEVDDAFDAMTSGARRSAAAAAAAPEPFIATSAVRRVFERARREFSSLQRRYARRLGLDARSGAQVHHAIELNVIVRYGDDVFSVEELNALRNMRGIVPERTAMGEMSTRYGLRQLHNSRIRLSWDSLYERINRAIADEGLVAGTAAYRSRVRAMLEHGRDVIDHQLSEFFSGSGARLTEEFVDEASDAARRGGRSAYGLTTRGTDGRITGVAPRFRVADPDPPRVRVEVPEEEIEEALEDSLEEAAGSTRRARRMTRD